MSTHRYKNNTDSDLSLVGVGVVKAGETIELDHVIENQNLVVVTAKSEKKPVNKEDGDGRA